MADPLSETFAALIERIDADGNGSISPQEIEELKRQMAEQEGIPSVTKLENIALRPSSADPAR